MTIRFYTRNDPHFGFTNFSPHGFQLEGRYWPSVEHYFQARKFPGTAREEEVRLARTPKQAKELAWRRDQPIRPDWDQVREDVMRRALRAKFAAHAALRAELLATGEEELVEASPSDAYWGCGRDGAGLNRLGVLLMELRAALRAEAGPAHSAARSI